MYFKFKDTGEVEVGLRSLPTENSEDYTWVEDDLGINIKRLKNGKVRKLTEKELEEMQNKAKLELFKKQVISYSNSMLAKTNYLLSNDVWYSLSENEKLEIIALRNKLKNIEKEKNFPKLNFLDIEKEVEKWQN